MPNYLISPKDIYSAEDENGHPLEGGQLFTYIAGSSTPADTWTDASGSVANTNPIVLDARGEARVWLSDELVYKYVLKTSVANGSVTIRTTDNIQANNGGGGGGLSSVTHSDSLTISLEGLGTAPSPLTADVLISSISANALGITTGGLYVTDLSDAVADKLDKVDPTPQSVVSSVDFLQGARIRSGFFGAGSHNILLEDDTSSYIWSKGENGLTVNKVFDNSSASTLDLLDSRITLLSRNEDLEGGVTLDSSGAQSTAKLQAADYTDGDSIAKVTVGSGNDSGIAASMSFELASLLSGGVDAFNFIGANIKVDGDITNSFDTSKISLLELSMILATSTGESISFGADTMLLNAGPSNIYLSTSGINFAGLNGFYQFQSVPDGTPDKAYAQNASGNLVKFDPVLPSDLDDKLDKVQAGAQSVVSEVELKQGLDITGVNPDGSAIRVPDDSWIMPQTAGQSLYLTNGTNPSTANSVLHLGLSTLSLVAGNGANELGSLRMIEDHLFLQHAIAGVGKDHLILGDEEISLVSKAGRGFYLTATNAEMSNTTSNISMGVDGIRLNGLNGGYEFVNVPDGTIVDTYGRNASGKMVKGSGGSVNEEVFINQISTGVNYGLSIGSTVLSGTEVTIDLGQGFVIDRADPDALTPKLYKPTFSASFTYEIVDTVSPSMFLYMDKTGAIQEFNTQDDERKHDGLISLGALGVLGGVIVQVVPLPNLSYSPMSHLLDLSGEVGIIRNGALISAVNNTLNLAQGLGSILVMGANFYNNSKNPNRLPITATSPITYIPATPASLQGTPTTTIDTDNYLLNGSPAVVPTSDPWTICEVYIGADTNVYIFQGQEVTYKNKNDAKTALALGDYPFTNHPIFANNPNNAIHAGSLIVKKGMANLNDSFWRGDNRFGLGAGGGGGAGGAFLDKATIDPQSVAGAVNWAGTQTFEVDAVFDEGASFENNSLFKSGVNLGGFSGFNSDKEAIARFTETDTTFHGGWIGYNGIDNHLEFGSHPVDNISPSSDVISFYIDRDNSEVTFEKLLKSNDQILQGSVTNTGEGIICESLKSEGDTKSVSFTLSDLNAAPSSATDTGVKGEIRYTTDYIYTCVATNTWKRSPLTTW